MMSSVRGIGVAAATCLAGEASATWSILIVDTKTGEIAVGSATCLTGFDLRENTPVIVAGVGAATAQSLVDSGTRNRSRVLRGLLRGDSLDEILGELEVSDSIHEDRQYGFVDARGDAVTFTGSGAGRWAGGVTGVLPGAGQTGGDLHYAVQGNVLTGEPVVLEAELALIATSGPLSDRLMAAMESARDFGGDGRCSCDQSPPDACGAPPASFEKSADIGYMLVARPGDRVLCRPFFPQDEFFTTVAAQTNAGEPARRVAGGSESGEIIRVWDVLVGPTGSEVTFVTALDIPAGTSIPYVGFMPIDGDERPDLLAIVDGDLRVYMADSQTGMVSPVAIVDRPFAEVSKAVNADFDGDGRVDIAGMSAGGVWFSWNLGGAFSDAVFVPIAGVPADMDVVERDGPDDLVVISSDDAVVSVIPGDPARLPSVQRTLQAHGEPVAIAGGDFDGDGASDVVFGSSRGPLSFLPLDDAGAEPIADAEILSFITQSLRVLDINSDGLDDVMTVGPISSTVLTNDPQDPGAFIASDVNSGRLFDYALADLDGDREPDLTGVSVSGGSALTTLPGISGGFADEFGCANGDLYLPLNVADQTRSDPDPVDQLRVLYDAWRAERVGASDAVMSRAFVTGPSVPVSGPCPVELRVSLRDLDGDPVVGLEADAIAVTGSSGLLAVETFEVVGPGEFFAPIASVGEVGVETLTIWIDDPATDRTIRLTPDLEVLVRDLADTNLDGSVTTDDFGAWLDAFLSGDPIADQNRDGRLTPTDFGAWLSNFNKGC